MLRAPVILPAGAPIQQPLDAAIREFQEALDDKQRQELLRSQSIPNADAILVFTAELDASHQNRRGPSVGSRLHTVLLSVRDFCSVINTFVASNPGIAPLIWGSVRLTMLLMSNFTSYYEAASKLFVKLGNLCPLFTEYQILYPSSLRLQKSLVDFYASIVCFCKHLVLSLKRPWQGHVFRMMWSSFDVEFKSDVESIQRCSDDVRTEMMLAKIQTDLLDQAFQAKERDEAARGRLMMMKFASRTDSQLKNMNKMQLQRSARNKLKRRKQLLDQLSTHDHLRPFKQNRQKRHTGTAQWVLETQEFHSWTQGVSISGENQRVLWLSGKIGSGKTVVTTSVIDHILLMGRPSTGLVSFFFVQFDDQESLSAERILKSLLRQRLDQVDMGDSILKEVETINQEMQLDRIVTLLQDTMVASATSYIIIDGLDELVNAERQILIKVLSSLAALATNIRIFLSGRDSIRQDLLKYISACHYISMDSESTVEDIVTYVDGIVEEKIEGQELRLGEPALADEIKMALVDGAQGMFLWVFFQIQELCSQHSDEDIRKCLSELPRDLAGTFRRALRRIIYRRHHREAQVIFPWIVATKRLLSLDELRDAIAVEVGQKHFKPERLYNDMENIASWCENLIIVEEESHLVQFSHSSVMQYLLEEPSDVELAKFHVRPKDANHQLGEVCMTYLNFEDFKRNLILRPKSMTMPDPMKIAHSVLPCTSKRASLLSKIGPRQPGRRPGITNLSTWTGDSKGASEKMRLGYPFLEYSTTYWLAHTTEFEPQTSKTWNIWKDMVIYGRDICSAPWISEKHDDIILWAGSASHHPIVSLLLSMGEVSESRVLELMNMAAKRDDTKLLNIILRDFGASNNQMSYRPGILDHKERGFMITTLQEAQEEQLYTLGLIHLAVKEVDFKAVEKLLTQISNPEGTPASDKIKWISNADILIPMASKGVDERARGMALGIAACNGNVRMVEELLSTGFDVATRSFAVQTAVWNNKIEVVEKLLATGVNEHAKISTLRMAAMGCLPILEILLKDGLSNQGKTWALVVATWNNQIDCVEKIIASGVDPGAIATASFVAHVGGSDEIMQKLMEVSLSTQRSPYADYMYWQ
ncbi:hypothetical protein BX600DRAFT_438539 [Xylariales sp. PMI_506]|nr:hypothetical protein BX600DRAFT_438539 [Xylariales sp. PMI_506]